MANLKHDTIGEMMKEQRLDNRAEIKQTAIAAQERIHQPTLSAIENKHLRFEDQITQPQQRLAILRAYKFTEEEIRELNRRFNLGLEFVVEGLHRVYADGPTVRYFGAVNAGLVDVFAAEDEVEQVSVPDWINDRFDLSRVFAMDIVGDSMACESVQHSIPEGSRVYFLEGAEPSPEEVVCCRLFEQGIHVIKVFRPAVGYAILVSYNHKHEPIVLSEDNPGDVTGVYLTHIPRGPRLR